MAEDESSGRWTKANVIKELREKSRGKPVTAQVFLSDDVAADDVSATVKRIVSKVEETTKAGAQPLKVGKIHKLAKSFSIEADPDAVAAIADQPSVKNVLPSDVDDIYPKPVKVKRV